MKGCLYPALFLVAHLAWASPGIYIINDVTGGRNTTDDAYNIRANETKSSKNTLTDQKSLESVPGFSSGTVTYPDTTENIIGSWEFLKSSGEKFYIVQAGSELFATVTKLTWYKINTGIEYYSGPLRSAILNDKIFFTNPSGIDDVFYWDGTLAASTCDDLPFIPRGFDIESNNNMMFVGGTYANPSTVFYSRAGINPASALVWDENSQFALFGYGDGDIVRCLKSYQGDLYIFKDNSTWALRGNDPATWDRYKLSEYYGCKYPESIQILKNMMMFFSKKGMVGYNGSFHPEIDDNIRNDILDSNNMLGETYFWQLSNSDVFGAGVSTGIATINNKMELESRTKIWNSSATYPTAFSSGTFSNTKIVGGYVSLKSTHSYVDLSENFSLVNILERTYSSISGWGETQDIEYNNSHRIYDDDFTTVSTSEEPTTNYFGSSRYYSSTNINESKLWFDFEESTNTITKIRHKIRLKPGIIFYTQNVINDYDTYSFQIRVTVFYNSGSGWQSVGNKSYNKTFQGSQFYIFSQSGFYGYRLRNDYDLVAKDEDDTVEFSQSIPPSSSIRTEISIFTDEFIMPNVTKQALCYINYPDIYEIEFYKDGGSSSVKTYYSTATYSTEIHDLTEGNGLAYLSTATYSVLGGDPFNVESTSITFKVAASSWSATLSGATWYDSQDGSKLNSNLSPCRYVQVKSSFTTAYSSHTPTLQSMTIGAIISSGPWVSTEFNAGIVNDWDRFISDETYDISASSVVYDIRHATATLNLDAAAWHTITSGTDLSTIIGSTGTWVQLRVTIKTTDGTKNPFVESMTAKWHPTAYVEVIPQSTVVDDRYHIGLSTITGSEVNTIIYTYNRNGVWTTIEGVYPGCFAPYGSKTYMADANDLSIWEWNNGHKIGGDVITWEREYKNIDFTDLTTGLAKKHFNDIFVTTSGTGTLTFSYKLNSQTDWIVANPDEFTENITNWTRLPITAGSAVSSFQPKVSGSPTLKLHNIVIYFTEEKSLK